MQSRPQSFADVVGDNVQSRMLEFLTGQDESLRQHEIADRLDVSQASISRATNVLEEAGVITIDDDMQISLDTDAESGIDQINTAIGD